MILLWLAPAALAVGTVLTGVGVSLASGRPRATTGATRVRDRQVTDVEAEMACICGFQPLVDIGRNHDIKPTRSDSRPQAPTFTGTGFRSPR